MASDKVINLDQENFESTINSDTPVLVDFWAAWCGPCRMVAPVLDELAEEKADKVTIAKLNVDDHQELAAKFEVRGIPTFILFKDGEPVDRLSGAMPKSKFEQFIDANV